MQQIEAIQATLKPDIHFRLEHTSHEQWAASLITERNCFPHWISYRGQTPEEAIDKLTEFLTGKREDCAVVKRQPEDFMKHPVKKRS